MNVSFDVPPSWTPLQKEVFTKARNICNIYCIPALNCTINFNKNELKVKVLTGKYFFFYLKFLNI